MSIDWAEITSNTLSVLAAGLVLGAGIPLLFSLGIRLQDIGAGGEHEDGTVTAPKPLAKAGAYAIFAVVVALIIYGMLFLTKASLSHYLGIELPI